MYHSKGELCVADEEQVRNVKKLQQFMLEELVERKASGQFIINWQQTTPVPLEYLESLAGGCLMPYRISTDSVAHFLNRNIYYLELMYDRARYQLKLLIREDVVLVYSRDRATGLQIKRIEPQPVELMQ